MPATIAVLNGPNLGVLGRREPHLYGTATLDEVAASCRDIAGTLGYTIDFRQTNHEGSLVEHVLDVADLAVGVVVNAAALTHSSIAVRDALAMCIGPVVEVHISNVHRREPFRHRSYISGIATAVIVGCGVRGYEFAIRVIAEGGGLIHAGKASDTAGARDA